MEFVEELFQEVKLRLVARLVALGDFPDAGNHLFLRLEGLLHNLLLGLRHLLRLFGLRLLDLRLLSHRLFGHRHFGLRLLSHRLFGHRNFGLRLLGCGLFGHRLLGCAFCHGFCHLLVCNLRRLLKGSSLIRL